MADADTDQLKKQYGQDLIDTLAPHETYEQLVFLTDKRTGASYCECHLRASTLVASGTIDVPLDPDEQADYRANREIVVDAGAFKKMQSDAENLRSFSHIVAEFNRDFDCDHPIKIVGGQHRFTAINEALEKGIDELHGVKLYFGLTKEQRLDVQLISNTSIAISGDLYDRMQETVRGPGLRNWCQETGLLATGTDFADKRERGGAISVQVARTFILNYFLGKKITSDIFDESDTAPVLSPIGQGDPAWDALHATNSAFLKDEGLREAAKQFAKLTDAQRGAFVGKPKTPADFPEKSMNLALLAGWAYVAGALQSNAPRLARHYALAEATGRDPLNAAALIKGRHKTDSESYRGLGYRTDAKERGRFAELFFDQAEDGTGITSGRINVAIAKYYAKQAHLEVVKAKSKA
ncbi:MAG: hypothetical protein Q8M32_14805 [Brevundimonas sp.]|nr:hypothetical protein [Brevundimonas sp.]